MCSAADKGTVERIKVHGKSLEGNLEGDSPDRDVSIYLPASYATEKTRRYPVIYFLHGFTDSDDKWFGFTKHWINLPDILDKTFGEPGTREMIVVMPNAFTRYQGSMYSNSVTTGNWEDFIVRDLVPYIDAHYRTFSPSGEPRPGRPLDGRLRHFAHRHASSRSFLQPLCAQRLLHGAS